MNAAKPLVVIIEDDHSAADALALILSDWGAEVVHRTSSAEALAALGQRAEAVRWIITDFHLGPGPTGVSFTPTLKAAAPQARILVLSGSSHGRANAEAAAAGLEIMRKPARAEAIVAWLERG